MRKNPAPRRKARMLASAALVTVLLIATSGCTCVTINMAGPPGSGPQGPGGPGWLPGGSGGNFSPSYWTVKAPGPGIPTSVCGQAVGRWVYFQNPAVQYPSVGDLGFTGYLYNETRQQLISNDSFILQWAVSGSNKGCCTNVTGDLYYVGTNVIAEVPYQFTAYFRSGGGAPALNDKIWLFGNFTH